VSPPRRERGSSGLTQPPLDRVDPVAVHAGLRRECGPAGDRRLQGHAEPRRGLLRLSPRLRGSA